VLPDCHRGFSSTLMCDDAASLYTCCQHAVGRNITGEYVEDTEEYINIELDSSRNRLIKLEVVLTAGTFALAIFTLVGGEFVGSMHGPVVCT
jgi:hypothetical protein